MCKDLFIPGILAALLFLLINPFDWWMNGAVYMGTVAIALILFSVFAVFLWREKPKDEREVVHIMFAGRAAYFLGAAVLAVAITAESFNHSIDPWLPGALLFMIIGKAAALWWSRSRN